MPIWKTSTRDIKIDPLYGDIELINNDIKLVRKPIDILRETVIERYKSNLGDFRLNLAYGANLDKNIGKGISTELVNSIITSFRYCLTYDNFIDSNTLEIIPLVFDNTLKLYTYIDVGTERLSIETYYKEGVFEID